MVRTETKRNLLFIAVGILMNIVGSYMAEYWNLPIYLDSTGTIFTSAACGLAGIFTGLFTNLIKCIWDSSSIYYIAINVLIAVATALLIKKRAVITLIPILTFIGGFLGNWITAILYNKNFFSTLKSSLLYDFIDKTISVVLVFFILYFLHIHTKGTEIRKHLKRSIRSKLVFFVFLSLFFSACIQMFISVNLFRQSAIEMEESTANSVCKMMADILADNIEEYKERNDTEAYRRAEEQLMSLRGMFPNIKYMYVYQIKEDGCHVVFDLETEETEASPYGEVIPFDKSFENKIEALLDGKEIEPMITDDTYGYLMTVYKPIGDCYAGVDIEMTYFREKAILYLVRVMSVFIGFSIAILYLIAKYLESAIFSPILSISSVAENFVVSTDEDRQESLKKVDELEIHTRDEIEDLYDSISEMTHESVVFMDEIQHQKEALSKMQDGLITVLADVVESRDACTGTHIKNTTEYVHLMLVEMKKGGKYSEYITDEFVANVESSAPLHDVGKIRTPDAILNKPGRLTDDEYTIMKEHSLNGNDIIEEAIELVPEPMFLSEAKNMALYHHERWDGKGYPYGLKGEEIPLSARIMAVADVYDALVSKRSYKEGFPKEEALRIIGDGAGTFFDPYIANMFVEIMREKDTEEKI